MSVFRLPTWVIKKINQIRQKFLWNGLGVDKKAYNLIEWSQVCKSNEKGGLGIINMENMNKALLTRWWWNLLTQPDKTINKIFKDRYGPRRGT